MAIVARNSALLCRPENLVPGANHQMASSVMSPLMASTSLPLSAAKYARAIALLYSLQSAPLDTSSLVLTSTTPALLPAAEAPARQGNGTSNVVLAPAGVIGLARPSSCAGTHDGL